MPDLNFTGWSTERRIDFAWRQSGSLGRDARQLGDVLKMLRAGCYSGVAERESLMQNIERHLSGVEDYAASVRQALTAEPAKEEADSEAG